MDQGTVADRWSREEEASWAGISDECFRQKGQKGGRSLLGAFRDVEEASRAGAEEQGGARKAMRRRAARRGHAGTHGPW